MTDLGESTKAEPHQASRMIQPPTLDGVPMQYVTEVKLADRYFLRARAASAAGDEPLADDLRDRAEAIYERLERTL